MEHWDSEGHLGGPGEQHSRAHMLGLAARFQLQVCWEAECMASFWAKVFAR